MPLPSSRPALRARGAERGCWLRRRVGVGIARWARRILYTLLLLLVVAPAGILALLNRGQISVDLAFAEFTLSKPLAFTAVFGLGWLFGLLCAAGALLKGRAGRGKGRPAGERATSE